MSERTPVELKNLDRYGNDPMPWSRPRDLLIAPPEGSERRYFVGTATSEGVPHAARVGAIWVDGDLYFTSNPDTRNPASWRRTPPARSPSASKASTWYSKNLRHV